MTDHPDRERLIRELHARPFIALDAPLGLLHLVLVHCGDADAGAARARLDALCRHHGVEPPAASANHLMTRFGSGSLKWECHAEFTSWTWWHATGDAEPFAASARAALAAEGLDDLPGALLVAVRVHVLDASAEAPLASRLAACFDPRSLCGADLGGGATRVWADFRPDTEGFLRMLVHDRAGDEREIGRRVQRLLEVETYRSMALLALPVAQALAPRIARIEERLAESTAQLESLADLDAERTMLASLMRLAAESEEIAAGSAYRFSASRAYFDIVRERLERLAQGRLAELPTIASFMHRRLSPAMRTCESTAARLEALAARITRAANLLRTRVELAMAAQNRDLLRSMERRARLQLRLQQTVEGLSVAAITYYVVGLVGYLSKAAHTAGVALDADLATGAAVPVVAGIVWLGLRRFRRRIEGA